LEESLALEVLLNRDHLSGNEHDIMEKSLFVAGKRKTVRLASRGRQTSIYVLVATGIEVKAT
jgi:hypothetical protein